jgi:hypothetical protein
MLSSPSGPKAKIASPLQLREDERGSERLDDPVEETRQERVRLRDERPARHVGGVRFPHRLEERGVPGDVCEEKRSVADLRLTRLIVCQRRSSFHVDVQIRERYRPAERLGGVVHVSDRGAGLG